MRFACALLALCSCNQVFGLDQTVPLATADAQYFDAPIDAPFACPPPGQTPQYSRLLHQIPQRCAEYSASFTAGRAIALCSESGAAQIAQGPLDGPFDNIAGYETVNGIHYDAPRMMPEGDEVIVRRWDMATIYGQLGVYRRTDTGITYEYEIKLPNNAATETSDRLGSPSRGPTRRVFYRTPAAQLEELEVSANGASTTVSTYTDTDLGVQGFAGLVPNLTPDGLHIVFYGVGTTTSGIYYSDRETISARFRPATLLMGVPTSGDAFLSDNCERVYFSAIGYVFWVQQL